MIGLRARYSLVWTSQLLIPIAFAALSLFLARAAINDNTDSAKRDLASACLATERAASIAASAPNLLASNVNEMTASGAESLVHGLAQVLDIGLVAVQSIISFVIDLYRSLYLCLADLVVRGSLTLLIDATQEAEQLFTNAATGIRTELQNAVGTFNTAISSVLSTVNALPGIDIDPPQFDIPALEGLANVQFPTTASDALTRLNATLPTLDELRAQLDSLISIPFDALRNDVKETIGIVKVDRTLFPVPQAATVTLCTDLDTSVIDDIAGGLLKGIHTGLAILFALLAIGLLVKLFLLRRAYRKRIELIEESRAVWRPSEPSPSALHDFLDRIETPFLHRMMDRLTPKRWGAGGRARVGWFVSYISWPPALLILSVAVIGLLALQLQLIVLGVARRAADGKVAEALDDFANKAALAVNEQMGNSSATFAASSNSVLVNFETTTNEQVFGNVNQALGSVNTTINAFYDGLERTITDTFGQTPLGTAAQGVAQCLIGNKVDAISRAITFVHNKSRIDLPRMSPNVLLLDEPSTLLAAFASGNEGASNVIDRLLDSYKSSLETQRLLYLIFLALYLLVLAMGIVGALWTRREAEEVYLDEKALPLEPIGQSRFALLRCRMNAAWGRRRAQTTPVIFAPPMRASSLRSSFGSQGDTAVFDKREDELPTHFRGGTTPLRPFILSTTRHQPTNPFVTPFDAPWER